MAEDPVRAEAFELLTDTWDKAGQLALSPRARRFPEQTDHRVFYKVALASVLVVLILGAVVFDYRAPGVSTAVGEQRTLNLADGTRIYLNTNSRAIVRFDGKRRRIVLERGEALFEVAHYPNWPFIVTSGDRQIRALGTTFEVRRDAQQVAITLVEGRVAISPQNASVPSSESPSAANGSATATFESVTLAPGQRATYAQGQPVRLDHPSLENVTAWRHRQVSLDNNTLAETITEMNRYSTLHLVVQDPKVAAIRISGVFRAGDMRNFLEALQQTYHIQAREEGRDRIVLEPPEMGADRPPALRSRQSHVSLVPEWNIHTRADRRATGEASCSKSFATGEC
jgi:transmembrane sensor